MTHPDHPVFGVALPGVTYAPRASAYVVVQRPGEIAVVRAPRGVFLPEGASTREGEKTEDDHDLMWLASADAMSRLEYESHAWAVGRVETRRARTESSGDDA